MNGVQGHLIPAYSLSISRMSVVLRVVLIGCSAVPFGLFLVAEPHFQSAQPNLSCVVMLGAVICSIVAHEALHGLAFWVYTRRVSFGFKRWTALGPVFYAASIGSRFSRRQYQLACVAPQFLTILLALAATLHPPALLFIGMTYAAAANLSGGVVDIFVFATLFRFPKDAIVEDTQVGMEVYLLARPNSQ